MGYPIAAYFEDASDIDVLSRLRVGGQSEAQAVMTLQVFHHDVMCEWQKSVAYADMMKRRRFLL